MKSRKFRIPVFILCIILISGFTACSGPSGENTPAPVPDSSTEVISSPPEKEDPDAGKTQPSEGETPADTSADPEPDTSGTSAGSEPDTSDTSAGSKPDTSNTSAGSKPDTSDNKETPSDNETAPKTETGDGLLTEAQVYEIVLSRVPGAAASNITSFEKKYDDGRWQYEGELVYNGLEYEFEIDAQNGNILEWEIDD